jgi:O-antigen/teichoic acid export membrane protein
MLPNLETRVWMNSWSLWTQDLAQKTKGFLLQVFHSRGVITLADQAVYSAANFLTGVIIGRTCSKEEFGLYLLGFSIVCILIPLQSSLILGPYAVYCPRLKNSDLSCYTGSTLIHQSTLSVLSLVILSAAGVFLSMGFGPVGLSVIVWSLAATISLWLLGEYVRSVLFALLRNKTAFLLDITMAVIQIGGLLLLARWGFLSAASAIWISGCASGLAAGVWLGLRWKLFAFQAKRILPDLKQNWSFGKWLFADKLVYIASNQLYPWFLVLFYGTAATGIFAACLGTMRLANPFIIGMGNYLGPKMAHIYARKGKQGVRRAALQDTLVFVAVMGPFCILMLFFGDEIISLLYGSKYAGNGAVVGVLALGQLALALSRPANLGLNAIERPDIGVKGSLLALLSFLTLGFWLVKFLGPLGAAWGLLSGNLIIAGVRTFAFHKETKVDSAGGIA